VYVVDGVGSPCAWYRCYTPGGELKRCGHEVQVVERLVPQLADWADVVVFERRFDDEVVPAIQYCRSRGKIAVYEIDDDLWNIHPGNPARDTFSRPGVLPTIEEAIRACDFATTTTPLLAARLHSLNRDVRVLPNMLPDEYWRFDGPKEQSQDHVVIGWAGTATHAPDLALLEDTIPLLLDRYPNVDFVYAGSAEKPVEHERVHRIPAVGFPQYPFLVSAFDIGLAPLQDTLFNRCKSDLKVLEYAMSGIPVVASKVEPYERSIEHGRNGFLARNGKDWLKQLARLIEDADLRTDMGRRAQGFAKRRLISREIGLWEKAYGLC
jgi:glycosyltransferase involved in cell wall biosynthesis